LSTEVRPSRPRFGWPDTILVLLPSGESDMQVYHRTYEAEKILTEGFQARTGHQLTANAATGVWFSDMPLEGNEGAHGNKGASGDTLLTLEIPAKVLSKYEIAADGNPYREWLIPARIADGYGPPKIHDHDYAGSTPEELRQAGMRWEGFGGEAAAKKASEIRKAVAFFDKFGWLEPAKQKAEAPTTPKKPRLRKAK
jgi:hypothetical protein